MLLNNQWITEDIKEEIKKYLDTNGRRQWHPTPVLLSRKSHGWRSLVGCSPWGRWASDTTERLHFHFSLSCIGEGNGNPLQCSCLENPRDEGAWWAVLYGVAQSWTWLKWLSSSSSSLNCSTCGCSAVDTEYNEPFCRLCYCYKKSDSNCFSISAILQSTNNVIIYRY